MSASKTEVVAQFYDEVWTRYVPDIEASRRHLGLFFTDGEIRGRTVLDAGCGSGVFSVIFAEKNASRVIGIDVSEGSLAGARKLGKRRGVHNLELRNASMLDLPFPDGYFDIVWAWGAVHHTDDPPRAMRELMRVVKDGGTILLTHYRRTGLTSLHEAIRQLLTMTPRPAWNALSRLLSVVLCPLIAMFKKREKLRQGERLSELILDWYFTPLRRCCRAEDVRQLLEAQGFVIEAFVPASGRFDSTSNFIFKARCLRKRR